ncbi:dihydroxyacetone kinase subunit DhaK [Cohaesibacter sp. CAU 1516]|uniref:dihydroxyacetone kinase subunit DhaL n=1 Tax=Cohaesibacter sp. CAU 1516 TaxID=2576038 RepID=UPI0010FE080C|nr:dihydroxyacetone kinase subunit DhaL [Cohaesibacter sp. CAU 1516]TLP44205.1 dihydroxyacetone kinase subunit DhaK [Cohaesibacter sp. CAU 1516]
MSDIRTKKLINEPEGIIAEAIEGMILAYPDRLRVEGATGRAVVAINGPRDDKVGIVVGGGSGHEPMFAGYVGRGLADAAAVGNVFASPSPDHIMDAARAVDGGAGVLFLYGNYTGDVLNFDMAVEECEASGIPARSIAIHDDVASAPADRMQERRGVAGNFFVFKVAGAAAEQGSNLEACEAIGRHALANTRSMGVALTACSLPQTGKPNFDIGHDEMEIGMGVHGEPGMRRGKLKKADEVTDELLDTILAEMQLERGDSVSVLVNGLGATGQLELFILHRRVAKRLEELGISIYRSWVGEYATSLEMAGASISLMKMDDELKSLLSAPCQAPCLTVAGALAPQGKHTPRASEAVAGFTAIDRSKLITKGPVTPVIFRDAMLSVAAAIAENRDWLSKLDGVIGDGDHGVTMDIGWTAVKQALADSGDETITDISNRMARAFLNAVGASTGPLYASAFKAAAVKVEDRLNLDATGMVAWIEGISTGILSRGGAAAGDKTMIDAWIPAVAQAQTALRNGGDLMACLEAACKGAKEGRDYTAGIESKRGRSKKLGARSIGHMDPGAASAHLMLVALTQSIRQAT